MNFRTRLTSFFVLVVVVPLAAVGFLVSADRPTSAMPRRVTSASPPSRLTRIDGAGMLHVTASVGAAASSGGNQDQLIGAADSAL